MTSFSVDTKGVYISELPPSVSTELLLLYFENRKSGGNEDAIIEEGSSVFTNNDGLTSGIVRIDDRAVIANILGKKEHIISGQVISVEPYIPRIHDNRTENISSRGEQQCPRQTATSWKPPIPPKPVLSFREYCATAGNQESDLHLEPESQTQTSGIQLLYEGSSCMGAHTDDKTPRIRPKRSRRGGKKNRNKGQDAAAGDDGSEDDETDKQEQGQNTQGGNSNRWRRNRSDSVNKDVRQQNNNASGDKNPRSRSQQRWQWSAQQNRSKVHAPALNDNTNDGDHDVMYGAKHKQTQQADEKSFTYTEDFHVTRAKFVMLRISAFQRKYSSPNARVKLNEKNSCVQFACTSERILQNVKLKMLEILNQIECESQHISDEKCQFFQRMAVKNLLEVRCIKEKMYVHIEADCDTKQLLFYGLSQRDIQKGLEFMGRSWHQRTIKLRDGQHELVQSEDWKKLSDDLNSNVTIVYIDNDTDIIHMECLFEESHVQTALRRVIHFLKSSTPKNAINVVLQSPKAELFKKHIQADLESLVKTQRGTLTVVKVQEVQPLILEISAEGSSKVVTEVQRRIDEIASEGVSFKDISSDDVSIYQIMKGIDSRDGQTFLSEFEKLHDCVVDVQKEGQYTTDRQLVADLFDVVEDESISSQKTSSPQIKPPKPALPTRVSSATNFPARNLEYIQLVNATRLSPPPDTPTTKYGGFLPVADSSTIFKLGHTTVEIKRGYIQREQVDGIVNMASPSWNIQESMVSKAILKSAGPNLHEEFTQALLLAGQEGNVIVTSVQGRLLSQMLLHIKMKKGAPNCRQSIRTTMKELNQACQQHQIQSLAMPPLGVGRMYQYDATTAATYMKDYISKYLTSVMKVSIVIYHEDQKTYNTFVSVFRQDVASPTAPQVTVSPTYRRQSSGLGLKQYSCPDLQGSMGDYHQLRNFSEVDSAIQKRPYGCGGLNPSHPFMRLNEPTHVRPLHTQERVSYDSKDFTRPITSAKALVPSPNIGQKKLVQAAPKYIQDAPISNIRITICAINKFMCQKAKRELDRKIPQEFLYEKTIKRRFSVKKTTLANIEKIVKSNGVRAVRDKDVVHVRGYRPKVEKVYSDITELLLHESGTQEIKAPKKPRPQRGTSEYIQAMAYDEEINVPHHWERFPANQEIKSVLKTISYGKTETKFERVRLKESDAALLAIATMVQQTFDSSRVGHGRDAIGLAGYSRLNVLSVERVENLELFNEYALQRRSLFQSLSKKGLKKFPPIESLPKSSGPIEIRDINNLLGDIHPEVNEVYLFHGTKPENIKNICNNGLDSRLSGMSAMFGPGVYGAETSIKADQYVDDKHSRMVGMGDVKMMFVIRMLLGDCYLCSDSNPPKFRTPPCTTCYQPACRQHSTMFDSVLGDGHWLNREFVVYKQQQCYPEYLVHYERV